MSDSVRPQTRQPTRLPRPWDSPGKNTGVGCHFLLQCMKVKSESEVAQLCPTLSNPMDCSLPGFAIHGIFQARELEWGAIAFSRTAIRSSNPTAGHTHQGNQNRKRHNYPNVHTALLIIARTWKQPRCPSANKWIRKLWHIYTMEYYSAIKKNIFESFLMRWMKLEPIIQSEVSQKEKHHTVY